jgi:hypothetical protein
VNQEVPAHALGITATVGGLQRGAVTKHRNALQSTANWSLGDLSRRLGCAELPERFAVFSGQFLVRGKNDGDWRFEI